MPAAKKSSKLTKKSSNTSNISQNTPSQGLNSILLIFLVISSIVTISVIYHVFTYKINSNNNENDLKPSTGTMKLIQELERMAGLGENIDILYDLKRQWATPKMGSRTM